MLSVAIAVSINFLPWATDIGSAQSVESSECDNVSQYYSQASGLEGAKLKSKLHEIVAGQKRLSYAEVMQAVFFINLSINFPSLLSSKVFADSTIHFRSSAGVLIFVS